MEAEKEMPLVKESSPEKHRRASESSSSSSDMLRTIVHSELQSALTENVIPDLMHQLETRMGRLQRQNLELVQEANTVLAQVQQSFKQIRVSQQTLNAQLLTEQSTSMHQGQKLDRVMSHQEAQQQILQQTVGDTRTGFQMIDRVVTNHQERLPSQGQSDIPAVAGESGFPSFTIWTR